jgi:copper chaperone
MQTVTLGISGMTCSGCVRSVTKVLTALDGVGKADVDLEKASAVVDYDPEQADLEQMKRAIEEAGYEVTN